MTLRTVGGHRTAETTEDLAAWLRGLEGCPPITRTVTAECNQPFHADDAATWFYVEADAATGVARRRCLACGDVTHLLDSAERWTFPPAWSCSTCRQSIAEVVFGLHDQHDVSTWLVMAVRCVECGSFEGVTDAVLAPTLTGELLDTL